jgi:outer membrane protein assembly factor BamB
VPDDFGVACVEADTGAERWRSAVTEGWPARLRLADGALWERRGDGEAWLRRDLATGRVRARGAPPASDLSADPTIDGFWTTADAILHEKDGEPKTVVTTGAFVDDLAVAGDVLAFTLDRDDGQILGFGLSTGRLRWVLRPRERVAGFEAGDGSRLELLGDKLLVHAPPALLAVDPASGVPAWSARVPALEGRWGPLRAISAGDAWIVSVDGVVVALEAETGTVLWSHDAGAGGATSPVAGGGVVCFDRRDEAVVPYALDEAEVARGLEVTVEEGRILAARWVRRSELGAGAVRVPIVELPAADGAAARLELSTPDSRLVLDAARLLAADGTVVVEVPGAWEDARLVTEADDLIALD